MRPKLRRLFKVVLILACVYSKHVSAQAETDSEPTEPPKPPCQEEFYDPSGTVESPNYPDNYPNDENCVYRILTNRKVTVTFDYFSLEGSENCRYDFMQVVFEATKPKTETDKDPERYCGDGLDKIEGGTLTGYGPLIIGFISDESDNMKGFKFSFEIDLGNEIVCDSDPCQHNGTCETHLGYYECVCHEAYAGVNCEINKDECASYPCKHGAKCVDGDNEFTCQCINGFEGDLCEINPDRCESDPCENGGICHSRNIDFVCSCPNDFMGDSCETPVPTFPPETTTPTEAPPTTVAPVEEEPEEYDEDKEDGGKEDGEKENGGKEDGGKVDGPNQDGEVDVITEAPTGTTTPPGDDGEGGGSLATILSILLVALVVGIILSFFLCYWLKNRRDEKSEEQEMSSPRLERKRSNVVEGKLRRSHSKTTSFRDSVHSGHPLNGNPLNGHHISQHQQGMNRLRPMTEEYIMDSDHPPPDEPYRNGSFTYNSLNNLPLSSQANNMIPMMGGAMNNNMILPPTYNMQLPQAEPFKQISTSGNDQNSFNRDKSSLANTYISPPSVQGKAPSQYSPDAALQLLNQIKEQGNPFGMNDPHHDHQTQYDQFNPNAYSTPQRDEMTLPHVPMPGHSNEAYLPSDYDAGIELSPEEAAVVVNNLLSLRPGNGDTVTSQEALDIISKVRNKDPNQPRPSYDREKSVVFKPQEVANILNSFRNRRFYDNAESDEKNGYELPSTYENSEADFKGIGRAPQEFRECTRITEASNETSESADKKAGSDSKKHLLEERTVRKRPKRFPYANTLDPADKVNDWLKNSSRANRPEKNSLESRDSCSVVTEAHIITRRLQPSHLINGDANNPNAKERDGPYKTIKQTPRVMGNEKRIPLTENKAKNLVEKLVRAPMRSNQNVVGPGLGVSRQNAFVGDEIKVESY